MARRGVMTALQAALAGIGGAAGGYVQMEETKRKRQLEDEARKRQEMRDIVELGDRDFVTGEQLAKQQEQGRRTTGSVVQNALLSALSPRAGMLPPPTAQDVGTASEALATAGRAPQRIVTAGGQEMFRAETPFQREERRDLLTQERKRMETMGEREYQRSRDADNRAFEKEMLRLRNQLTPYQRQQLALDKRKLDIMEQEKEAKKNEAAPTTSASFAPEDVDFLRQFAPKVEVVNNRRVYKPANQSIDALGVRCAQSDITNVLAGANEQRYAAIAGAISDAQARRSEKGVLTNQDIQRYRDQVLIRPMDKIETQYDKFRRLLSWADEGKPPLSSFEIK